jgi:ABC-type Zn uptake system ZnuABC Zn-binding protein ZnuA
VHVTNLTPPGAEPHDLELTPKSVDTILGADVAVVMGHGFQPAVEDAVKQRSGSTLVVLDRLPISAGTRRSRRATRTRSILMCGSTRP